MGIRQFKPVTKGTRFRSVSDFKEITRSTPEKSLLEPLKKSGGRDNHGHISMRRRGGGHKRMYRVIDFKRNKFGIVATVKEIEYDPNRSARIALVETPTARSVHPARRGCRWVTASVGAAGRTPHRNALPLGEVPLGTAVQNVEMVPGKGGQVARSAGMSAEVVAKEGGVRDAEHGLDREAEQHMALTGHDRRVGNGVRLSDFLGQAGKTRWKGSRPKVGGEVMNPVDHPHGAARGGRNVVNPWGKRKA